MSFSPWFHDLPTGWKICSCHRLSSIGVAYSLDHLKKLENLASKWDVTQEKTYFMRIICYEFKTKSGIMTFLAAFTESDTQIKNDTNIRWQVLPDNDRKSIKMKQKHGEEIVKSSVWLKNKQWPDKRPKTGVLKELWKFEVLRWFQNYCKRSGTSLEEKKIGKKWTKNATTYCCWDPNITYSNFTPSISVYGTFWCPKNMSQGPKAILLAWHWRWCAEREWQLWLVPEKKRNAAEHTHSLTTWQSSHPFWQVSLDVMGPLLLSVRCKYKLLIGDHLSKWHEAAAMPNQETQNAARTLVERWLTRYGCPVNLQ